MRKLLGSLMRITTADGLELHGVLYEPPLPTQKVVLHIHGWTGNFYENAFLDHIAAACIRHGYAFLACNTRGAGFVQEFLQKDGRSVTYVKIGGSLERFEDSILDIQAVVNHLEKSGYREFVIEGHSTGCQKAVYYSSTTKDPRVAGIILLEPADDPTIVASLLGNRYTEAIDYAQNLLAHNKPDALMPDWVLSGTLLSAQKFLSIADPHSIEGSILHVPGKFRLARGITCPLLVISASNSEYQDAVVMQKCLRGAVKTIDAHIIPDSGHWFFGHETWVGGIIGRWLG
jgi:pimeloyl-ACP methyl ester carboxylesterase